MSTVRPLTPKPVVPGSRAAPRVPALAPVATGTGAFLWPRGTALAGAGLWGWEPTGLPPEIPPAGADPAWAGLGERRPRQGRLDAVLSAMTPDPALFYRPIDGVYNGAVSTLRRCPREHCGGTILDGACLLCGRDPDHPPTVGTVRRPPARPGRPSDPYLALARRVLAIPEAEAESIMQAPPVPIAYSLRAQVPTPQDF